MKERDRERPAPFVNEHCSFVPTAWVEDEGTLKPVVLKVVTENLQSLGLRKNPNIMTFAEGAWVRLDDEEIIPGNADEGGIWTALRMSGARTLVSYMAEKYNRQARMFLAMIENPLYANGYRVKSQGIYLLEEIKPK